LVELIAAFVVAGGQIGHGGQLIEERSHFCEQGVLFCPQGIEALGDIGEALLGRVGV
jgi:hypothetical protein